MEAHMSLLIGGSQKLYKVSGQVPEAEQLVDELQDIAGIAWAEPGYGETWLGISVEAMPLQANDVIQSIRSVMAQRDLAMVQVNPVPC